MRKTTNPSKETLANLGALNAAERFRIIHDEIRHRICFLIYPPGTRLSETKLALEFGVSRTPIRSVLAQLEAEGLVESQQGVATRVTQIELAILRDEYELRMNLAELAGQMGVVPSTAEEIADLKRLCRELDLMRSDPSPAEYARINLEFHRAFLARIRNRSLQILTDRMYFLTSRIWLSKMPLLNWDNEISIFKRQIELMIEMFQMQDDRGIGILQRHIIYTSLVRLIDYGAK